MKRQQIARNNTFCPDLSDLLSEIGLPQQSLVGSTNPFMQCSSDGKISEVLRLNHIFIKIYLTLQSSESGLDKNKKME